MNLNKNTETAIVVILGIAIVYILYKGGKLLTDSVNGIQDVFGSGTKGHQADNKISELDDTVDSKNPFKPEFLEYQKGTVHLIPAATKKAMAKKIYNAAGALAGGMITGMLTGSKPSDIMDVFRQLKYKSQVADLASAFRTIYNKDMLTYITDGLRENQPLTQAANNTLISTMIDYAKKLK